MNQDFALRALSLWGLEGWKRNLLNDLEWSRDHARVVAKRRRVLHVS